MDSSVIIAVVVVLIAAAVIVVGWLAYRQWRLRRQFGPEYNRTVKEAGSRWRAESELEARRKRRMDSMSIPWQRRRSSDTRSSGGWSRPASSTSHVRPFTRPTV